MRFVKGFVVGGVVAGALAFAAGYNHGRGVPVLSNPFADSAVSEATERLLDRVGGAVDGMTGG